MKQVIEGSLVQYKDRHGYRVWGKVTQLYTSVVGYQCIELTNGERMKLEEVLKVK